MKLLGFSLGNQCEWTAAWLVSRRCCHLHSPTSLCALGGCSCCMFGTQGMPRSHSLSPVPAAARGTQQYWRCGRFQIPAQSSMGRMERRWCLACLFPSSRVRNSSGCIQWLQVWRFFGIFRTCISWWCSGKHGFISEFCSIWEITIHYRICCNKAAGSSGLLFLPVSIIW